MSKEILSTNGEKLGEITLEKNVFGVEPNLHVMHLALRRQLNNARQGSACAKTRAEVAGGGRKPWKQKGTGRARQGSIRATQWVGGGVPHGVCPRDYSFKINKKERVLALVSALRDKMSQGKIVVFENLELPTLKTKDIKELVKTANLEGKVLFVTESDCENLYMACRNLGYAYHIVADEINVLDILNADTLVFDEGAVKKIEEGMLNA